MEFELLKGFVKVLAEYGVLGLGWAAAVMLWRQNVRDRVECERRYEEIVKEVTKVVAANANVLGELNTRIGRRRESGN